MMTAELQLLPEVTTASGSFDFRQINLNTEVAMKLCVSAAKHICLD